MHSDVRHSRNPDHVICAISPSSIRGRAAEVSAFMVWVIMSNCGESEMICIVFLTVVTPETSCAIKWVVYRVISSVLVPSLLWFRMRRFGFHQINYLIIWLSSHPPSSWSCLVLVDIFIMSFQILDFILCNFLVTKNLAQSIQDFHFIII